MRVKPLAIFAVICTILGTLAAIVSGQGITGSITRIGSSDVICFGGTVGISLSGSNIAFGNCTAGNISTNILTPLVGDDANADARIAFGVVNAHDVCATAVNGTQRICIDSNIRINGGSALNFSSGALTNSADIGISRAAAGVLAVGSGAQGDTTGWIRATNDQTLATTVATLTTCNSAAEGTRAAVNNATVAFTAGIGTVVAGTGANHVPVYCDGTNWRIG